jgi:hypothetical protein
MELRLIIIPKIDSAILHRGIPRPHSPSILPFIQTMFTEKSSRLAEWQKLYQAGPCF